MKIVKIILFTLAGIIALALIAALFIPKTYTVSVSTVIDKPQQEVFNYVKLIKNQENYSIWVMEDSNAILEYKGVDGTVGFVASWNSQNDNVGEGEQEVTNVTTERIDVDLRFKRPFEGNQKAATIVKALSENQSQVTSEFYGKDSYPMNLMSLIGKKFIADAQTQNLKNLKTILEK